MAGDLQEAYLRQLIEGHAVPRGGGRLAGRRAHHDGPGFLPAVRRAGTHVRRAGPTGPQHDPDERQPAQRRAGQVPAHPPLPGHQHRPAPRPVPHPRPRPHPATGLAELTGPNPAPRKAATMHQAAIDDRERRLSASSPASGSSVNLTTCCSASGRPPMAPGSADPRTAAGRPLTCTLNCWPPSRTPPLSASANFAPRPLRRPAGARCSST
jgi:hypothetical protein